MPLWVRGACGIGACLLAAYETRAGRTVGEMKPDRLALVLVLLGMAFM